MAGDRRRPGPLGQRWAADDCTHCTGDTPVAPAGPVGFVHPALHGEDVVLAVTAMPAKGPDCHQATIGRQAPQLGKGEAQSLSRLRRSEQVHTINHRCLHSNRRRGRPPRGQGGRPTWAGDQPALRR